MTSQPRCALSQIILLVLLAVLLAACGLDSQPSRRELGRPMPAATPTPSTPATILTPSEPARQQRGLPNDTPDPPPAAPGHAPWPRRPRLTPPPGGPGDRAAFGSQLQPSAPVAWPDARPAVVPAPQPAVVPAPRMVLDWSADGVPDPLRRPIAAAIDRHGDLYVLDAGDQRIRVFDRGGRPVRGWGSEGGDAGQFRFLTTAHCFGGDHPGSCLPAAGGGVAVDEQDRVYVADFGNHQIQVFDRGGRPLARWGREGGGPGEFRWPRGIAVDAQGGVCVADAENHRLQQFDRAGRFLAEWGSQGAGAGQFDRPSMVAADRQGRVYAADGWHARLQQFDGRGRVLAAWTTDGLNGIVVARVVGLAVDRLGRVYASDTAGRVHWFAPDGQVLASWDLGRLGGGGPVVPAGLAVDGQDGLYVADPAGGRVVKYQLLTPMTG